MVVAGTFRLEPVRHTRLRVVSLCPSVAQSPTSIDSLSLFRGFDPRHAIRTNQSLENSKDALGHTGDATTMKNSLWYLLLGLVPVLLLASSGAQGAQLTVLGLTLGIFFGTLSLRSPGPSDATQTHSGI